MSLSETRCYARCTATRRCKDCEELFQATIASVALTTKAKNAKKQQRSRPASKPRPEKVAAKAPREKKKIDEKKLHRGLHLEPGVKILDIVGNNAPGSSVSHRGIGIRFSNGYTGWLHGEPNGKLALTEGKSYRDLIGASVKDLLPLTRNRTVVAWIKFEPDVAKLSQGTHLMCQETWIEREQSLTQQLVFKLPDGSEEINELKRRPYEEPEILRPSEVPFFSLQLKIDDGSIVAKVPENPVPPLPPVTKEPSLPLPKEDDDDGDGTIWDDPVQPTPAPPAKPWRLVLDPNLPDPNKPREWVTVSQQRPPSPKMDPLQQQYPSLMAPPFTAFLNSSSVPAKESAPHPLPAVSETTVQIKEPIVPAPLPALPLPPQQPVPVPVTVPLPLPPPPPPAEVAAPAKRPPSPTFDKPSPIERAIRIKRIRSEIEKSNTDIKAMLEQEKSWKDQREAHVKETKRLSKLLLEIRKSADGEFYKRQRNLLRLETVDTATWAWSDSYGDD